MKTLHNTDASKAKENVKDIIFWGDGDTFKLISKASSKEEGWMKSTKAMEITGVGCVVQVTTQQFNDTSMRIPEIKEKKEDGSLIWKDWNEQEIVKTCALAEAITFVPGVKIVETKDGDKVVSRQLVKM
jgi:hypothetical protein